MNEFQRLRQAGFQHLLPIIPHNATISSYSRTLHGRPEMLGKIPGKAVSDGWVGFAGWEDYLASDDDLAEWGTDGAGIGLRCADVVAVDIDVTDAALSHLIQLEAITHLGFAPTRHGNRPKALMLYRIEGDWPTKRVMSFRDYSGAAQAIELLGARQQFIVSGIHPRTGRPYEWSEDLATLGLDGLQVVTPDDLAAFLTACQASLELFDCDLVDVRAFNQGDERSPESLCTDDLDTLARVVEQMPNGDNLGYHDLTSMAHAIRAASGNDPDRGLEILQEWASRWPLGDDPDETARIYWSVHGSSIGVQWLYDQARQHGIDTLQADFGLPVVAANDEAPVSFFADDVGNGDSWWSRFTYVNQPKRFYDLRNGRYLDKEQFNDHFRAPEQKQKPADLFLETRPKHCFADAPFYSPGSRERVWYCNKRRQVMLNTWRPGPAHSGEWAGTADDAAVAMWLRLVKYLIPDERERRFMLCWMASLLQRPGQKPNWHPLLAGRHHGTGKDSIFVPLVRGLGHNARTIQASDLEKEWTWWAEDVQLVVVSELHSFERRPVMNRLKSHMATPPDTIEINKKGVPQYEVPNLFGLVMFSNNEDAAAIEDSDRRFFVVWTEAEALEDGFYAEYHAWMDNGGAAAVCNWLHALDLTGFTTQGRAPDTEAKDNMRQAAMGAIDGALTAAIEDESGPFGRDLFTIQEVATWLQSRVKNPPTLQRLGIHLKASGCTLLGRVRVGEERERIWCCRRGAMYLQAWQDAPAKVRDMLIEQRERAGGASADFGEARHR